MIQEKNLCFLWDNTIDGVIPVFEKFEAAFSFGKRFENPYCPLEVELKAFIFTPDGKQQEISGFWYEGFCRCLRNSYFTEKTEFLIPTQEKDWRIRYAARMSGEHRYYVVLEDKKNSFSHRYPETGTLSFWATPSGRKGFLQVSRKDPAYLEFSDGSPYLGIGHNLCGWEWGGTDNRQGTYEYDRWLGSMAENGANLAQFDFCEGDQIEWTSCENELPFSRDWSGLNRYNQQNAWKMDRRFQTAEELNIFFRLTLFHWEDFDDETEKFPDWGWNRNPYRSENGGFARNVSEFFENRECRQYVKYYLKYVTARWGYSPNLLAYELWNEIDAPEVMWQSGSSYEREAASVISWHREMGNYLKEADGSHLVTTSYADSRRDWDMWQLPCMDFTTVHRYTYFNEDYGQRQYDTEGTLAAIMGERFAHIQKPVLFGEFALSPGGDIQKDFDASGIEFHNQLWASLMVKSLGTAMHWTWGSYLDKNQLYREYLPISRFFQEEDLRGTEAFSNLNFSSTPLLIMVLKKTDRAYLWIKRRDWNFQQAAVANNPVEAAESSSMAAEEEAVSVSGLSSGIYHIIFFDTSAGTELYHRTAVSENGSLQFTLPEFSRDVAVKIRPGTTEQSWESIDLPKKKNNSHTEFSGSKACVTAGGAGFCRDNEEYRFVYKKISGDFQLTARVLSVTNLGEHVGAGLMVRSTLSAAGGYIAVVLHPYGTAEILRKSAGKTESLLTFDAGNAPCFRLKYTGGNLTIQLAKPGDAWETLTEMPYPRENGVYAGLTAASSHTITYITANFDQLNLETTEEEMK